MKLKNILSELTFEKKEYRNPPPGYVFSAIKKLKPGDIVYKWEDGEISEPAMVIRQTEQGSAVVELKGKGTVIPKSKLLIKSNNIKEDTNLLVEYIQYMKGHKNSKGELAEFVIKSHKTNKVISSHRTMADAKKRLQHIHIFK